MLHGLPPPSGDWPEEHFYGKSETAWTLLLPPIFTALLTLAIGLLAPAPFSPLQWARFITTLEYLP